MSTSSPADGKSVSLVLGSGGARGLAHIGVIRWLSDNGYRINAVAGSSIGALVGGIYAIGKLDDFEMWVRAITRRDMVTMLDLSLNRKGLIKGDKIVSTLRNLVGERQIESLPIPYQAVATDLEKEQEVWLSSGPLFDAIRASIAIPLLFTPFNLAGRSLVDGGVLNPLPLNAEFEHKSDYTIAVSLFGLPQASPAVESKKPAKLLQKLAADDRLHPKITQFIRDQFDTKNNNKANDISLYNIATQSVDAMQGMITRQALRAYPPDKLLEVSRSSCGVLEFNRAEELIELGYTLADQHLDLR